MLTEPIIPLAAPISSTNIATVSTIPSSIPSSIPSTTTTTTLSTEKEQQSKMQIDEHPSETTSMSTLVANTNNLSLDATTTQPMAPQPQFPPKNNDFEANLKGSFFRDFIVRNSPTTNVYLFLDKNKLTTKTFSCFGMLFFHYVFIILTI